MATRSLATRWAISASLPYPSPPSQAYHSCHVDWWVAGAGGPTRTRILHYRDRQLAEVDVIIEAPDGRVTGIEVKSGTDVGHRDVRHLAKLYDRLGDRFVAGVVLNIGPTALSLGERLQALPISVLWDSCGS